MPGLRRLATQQRDSEASHPVLLESELVTQQLDVPGNQKKDMWMQVKWKWKWKEGL